MRNEPQGTSFTKQKRMSFLEFKTVLKDYPVFSTRDVSKIYPYLHRRRLHEWESRGLLRRVLKGFYIFSDLQINESLVFIVANRIYDPSYVSLQSALNWYGLIPEFVPQVTSVSSRKTTTLKAEFGSFLYFSIKESLMFGYDLVLSKDGQYNVKMAYPEKALLDLLYLNPRLSSEDQFFELRINMELLNEMVDKNRFSQYVPLFENIAFEKRVKSFIKYIENA